MKMKIGLTFFAFCMSALLVGFVGACMAPNPGPDAGVAEVSQALTGPCKGGDGLIVHCHYSSTSDSCQFEPACYPNGGYCQETNGTEYTYCSNTLNCSRPEYHSYCSAGCPGQVYDPSNYVHNCINGPRP